MFYSHTFLARKGPLGTVWCAAHLQHKLKKSHYIATNVYETVDRIMYPEIPIALRTSGHLLLGVVRIYSKQVDYLFEDCTEIRNTINRVFTTESVNLPNDATHAPYHSITLPAKFDLDAMELDDDGWGEDYHLKSKDDITLSDQIPTGKNPYIVISFYEHESSAEDDLGSDQMPMEEDDPPIGMVPSPNSQAGPGDRSGGNGSPQDHRSVEFQREAKPGYDFDGSIILPDRAEPDPDLATKINEEKEIGASASNEDVSSVGCHDHVESDTSPIPFGEDAIISTKNSDPSPFVMQPSPHDVANPPEVTIQPAPPAQPRVRKNRKRLFDETTILSNRHMRDALNDASNICRVRRNCPAIWRQNNRVRLRKETLFVEPFITGMSADLQGIYNEDCVKHHLASTDQPVQETGPTQPTISSLDGVETEILRNYEGISTDPFMPDFSAFVTPVKSHAEKQSEHLEVMEHNDVSPPAADMKSSANADSDIKTPDTLHTVDGAHFDTPDLVSSPGELGFLEQDDNSPARSQGTPATVIFSKNQKTVEMSSRTRAVAQYLERQSVTPVAGNSDELSLDKILQGKTRKVCARMFYKTLVLKSLGLVEVHQERPYGDISLKVTPKLSKGKYPI